MIDYVSDDPTIDDKEDERKKVLDELSKSTELNFSRFRQIDKKLKVPAGSSYEISGWKDSLDYESKTT